MATKEELLWRDLMNAIDKLIELAEEIDTAACGVMDEITSKEARRHIKQLTKEGKLP
jgi:hypothetical protein